MRGGVRRGTVAFRLPVQSHSLVFPVSFLFHFPLVHGECSSFSRMMGWTREGVW
jgi:hypothetical protein